MLDQETEKTLITVRTRILSINFMMSSHLDEVTNIFALAAQPVHTLALALVMPVPGTPYHHEYSYKHQFFSRGSWAVHPLLVRFSCGLFIHLGCLSFGGAMVPFPSWSWIFVLVGIWTRDSRAAVRHATNELCLLQNNTGVTVHWNWE